MDELAALRRSKLEQCVSLTTFQNDAAQVGFDYIFLFISCSFDLRYKTLFTISIEYYSKMCIR